MPKPRPYPRQPANNRGRRGREGRDASFKYKPKYIRRWFISRLSGSLSRERESESPSFARGPREIRTADLSINPTARSIDFVGRGIRRNSLITRRRLGDLIYTRAPLVTSFDYYVTKLRSLC